MFLSLLLIALVIASAVYLLRQYWRRELDPDEHREPAARPVEIELPQRKAA